MNKGTAELRPMYDDPFIKGQTLSSVTGINSNKTTGSISGTLKYDGYSDGVIQIDAITAQTRDVEVVNMIKLRGPGQFAIPVGVAKKISLRAYIDAEGDGPDADDPRIDLSDTVIHLDQGMDQRIVIDLDSKTISVK